MTTLERDFAQSVALAIKSATAPLLARITVLEGQAALVPRERDQESNIEAAIVKATSPLLVKIAELEARQLVQGPPGRDGKDADLVLISDLRAELSSVRAEVLAVKAWPAPRDGVNGTSVTVADVAPLIAAEVTKAVALIPTPTNGLDGKSLSVEDVAPVIRAVVTEAVSAIPHPADGVSVSLDDVRPLIIAEVEKALAARPLPVNGKDGASVSVADLVPVIAGEVQKAVAAIPLPTNGKDGQSITPDDVRPLIQAEVAKIPAPKHGEPGKSVDPLEVEALIAAKVEKAVAAMPKPKDGLGIKSAVVNNDGRLLITLSDDAVQDLGVVVGKTGRDGMPAIGRSGADGTSVTVDDVRPMIHSEITKAVAAIPKPKDGTNGTNGKDGIDGLGFDDVDVVFDQAKGWLVKFAKGARVREIPVPLPYDAGIWTLGRTYHKGAGVTVKGAWYIAQETTRTRPDDGSAESARAWRLAVKGGRDGKPGKDGKDGVPE